jgi:hypothetical protein
VEHTELTERLTRVAATRNLADAAVESCRRSLEAARRESEDVGEVFCGGHRVEDLVLTWWRHALVFSHRILREPYIETSVEIALPDPANMYFEARRPIGSYRLITRLVTGDVEDDYLEWLPDGAARREYEKDGAAEQGDEADER